MSQYSHKFVEDYDGPVGFGFDREIDEATVKVYLQKFSDDELMEKLIPLLTDEELEGIFELISELLAKHLNKEDYQRLFVK